MSDLNYTAEPSYDVLDALRLVPLFYTVHWTDEKKAEWMRITGTTEATTKVMCDHVRSAIECSKPIRATTIEECVQAAHEALLGAARSGLDHYATAREVYRAIRAIKEEP